MCWHEQCDVVLQLYSYHWHTRFWRKFQFSIIIHCSFLKKIKLLKSSSPRNFQLPSFEWARIFPGFADCMAFSKIWTANKHLHSSVLLKYSVGVCLLVCLFVCLFVGRQTNKELHSSDISKGPFTQFYTGDFCHSNLTQFLSCSRLQLQNRTCKPGAIFSAICRCDIAGVSNMFET